MTDLCATSTTRLAELIRDQKVSPVEVLQACLNRIEEINPKLNAIVTIAPDALEKAKEAEAAVTRGDALGPLHGVPVTIKDTVETAGLRTTSGSAMRAGFIPERDAAAIASCMSPGGIGSDLAGSIRIPSHFCGVVGLKPTVGRVPGAGQFPPAIGPYSLGAVIGPMARSVNDLRLLFSVLAGNEMSGAWPASLTTGFSDARSFLHGRRVACYTDDGVAPVSEETRSAVEVAARALADAGLAVEQTLPPGVERGHDLWLKLFSRASVVQLRNVYAGHEEKGGDFVRERLATADETATPSLDDYIRSWLERDRLRAVLVDWMAATPLILAPVGATPAYQHGTHKVTVGNCTMSTFRAFSYSQAFNVFDLPVVVVPAGRSSEGLPVGIQIVGRPFAEDAVLAAATIIEATLGSWPAPPLSDQL